MKALSIINLGSSGFPHLKSAPVNKSIMINKILNEAGMHTIVINNEALLSKNNSEEIPINGYFGNTEYHYTIRTPYKPSSSIKKRILRFIGKYNEFFFLIGYKFRKGIDVAILLSDGSFLMLLYYRFLSLLLNYKLVIIYHEYRSDFEYRKKHFLLSINDKLFDNYFPHLVDAVLPISEYLITHVRSIAPSKPLLKIPPLVDFSLYEKPNYSEEKYFLYCGSAGYFDVIDFIIKSFEIIENELNFKLYLVIGGDDSGLKLVLDLVNKSKRKKEIKIFSDLSFENLISLYCSAKALLVPLKPDLRDTARFPQKIAEYVASGNPIISTNYGEVKHYFTDGVNGLIAESYDIKDFSLKLDFVVKSPDASIMIGQKGKSIGFEHFYFAKYKDNLGNFIKRLFEK